VTGLIPRLFLVGGFALASVLTTAHAAEEPDATFGRDVQLAPFVVNGKKLSAAVYARTKSDRRYGEKFAEEVVGIAYETMGDSTGKGLVVVGREGEPHPVVVIRKVLAMAEAGQLDPEVAKKAGELSTLLTKWKAMLHLDVESSGKGFKVTFDMVMPALPLPLEGLASKLYQISWAEDFDDTRVERKLRALTLADLKSDALSKYTWVFYLPPRNAFKAVEDDVIEQAEKHEKMGLLKRATLNSALFVFSPAIKTAVEGMRKSMLFMTVLQAESNYRKEDIMALTGAYLQVLMPDFKFNGGTEHQRALEAIERQKIKNADYAANPYVSPARLTEFDPAVYAPFEGEYAVGEGKKRVTRSFKQKDGAYAWQPSRGSPQILHPAVGERLLVSADGKMTVQFQIDENGVVTGAEERRERFRRTLSRGGGQVARIE
jgi:hypothetical protein